MADNDRKLKPVNTAAQERVLKLQGKLYEARLMEIHRQAAEFERAQDH